MGGLVNLRSKQIIVFAHDVTMAVLAVFISVAFRFDGFSRLEERGLYMGAIVPFTASAIISFFILRTYRTSWRHASTSDLITIVQTATLAVLIYLPLSFVTTRLTEIPRSFVLITWMIFFVLMAGSRVVYRLFQERGAFFLRRSMRSGQIPVLVVGGGRNGEIFLRSLDHTSEYYAVGVLDDLAPGSVLRGVPVLGTIAQAEKVIQGFEDDNDKPRKLVVVDRALSPAVLDGLLKVALQHGLTVGRVPDLTQLGPGTEDKPELQPIPVEDLLGRSQIVLDQAPVRALIAKRRVLITGAGGSIGSEIVRQVCAIGPSAVCLVDASEFNLYTIDAEVAQVWPELERASRIVDVRNRTGIRDCFSGFRPDIVFHAAALKHVPLVESNPLEGIWTNTIGSRNVSDAALAAGCQAMVMISTDKAVNPTNVMGASKRCAESYCQALALAEAGRPDATRFVAVRFGNVLGSTGSIVPLFERQLKAGGPLTVTHPDIERFFMTIREAVQLVLQASALGTAGNAQGKVFVLDMGEPVKIVDLARQMIRLSGRQPNDDIDIQFVGLRPGEKLYEELFYDSEKIEPTSVPRVNVASPRTTASLAVLTEALDRLAIACESGETMEAVGIMKSLVPEFVGAEHVPPPRPVLVRAGTES